MNVKFLFLAFFISQIVLIASCKKEESEPPNITLPETVTVAEGNETQLSVIIPVTLSAPSDVFVSFLWSTSDGTAKATDDFTAVTDSVLVFQPGETSKNIEVKLTNDTYYEPDETFYITTRNAKNGKFLNDRTQVTITNDDGFAPVVNVASVTKVEEGNAVQLNAKVLVLLSGAFDKPVTLKWSTFDGTAKADFDYVPVNAGSLVFAAGETQKYIEVKLVNDLVMEFNDSLYVHVTEVTNANLGNGLAKIIILNDDSFTPEVAADGPITPDTYPGMQLVWADEFNDPDINMSNWTFELGGGGWGNNEWEVYTNSPLNANISDGKLNIIATKTYAGYNSARMITKGKQEFTYGRIDIRAKMPYGQGIWPALWMLGGNISQVSWPSCGEIDIMEYLGHEVSKVHGTVHYNDGGHQYKGGSYSLPSGPGFNDKFHVFTILWQENSIEWYCDYQKYYEVTNANIKFDAFKLPQFFIFNVAVGGNWPGYPDATTVFPQTMQVDYIRVFMPS